MKPHFAKLDSIRFYAFILVFISHSYFNSKNDLSQTYPILLDKGDRWFAHGELGVQIFFVLSGFLITFLSIREIQKTNDFSILHFFKKRILRIWPLYFLVIAISYLLYIIQGKAIALGCTSMYLYFLGNVCIYKGLPDVVSTVTIAPLWSVSVEQQFYTIFPFLFLLGLYGYRKSKKITTCISLFVLALITAVSIYIRYLHAEDWAYISYTLVSALPALIIGIFLAMSISAKEKMFIQIARYRKTATMIAVLLFLYGVYLKFTGSLGVALYIVPICLTTILMIVLSMYGNTSDTQKEIPSTKLAQTTQYLGKISYGLYVYHMLSIVSVNYVYTKLEVVPEYLPNIYSKIVLTFGLTILISHLSYQYFEKWFLKFK